MELVEFDVPHENAFICRVSFILISLFLVNHQMNAHFSLTETPRFHYFPI